MRISHDGLVYVCDRTNDRVQVFRKDGTFVQEAFIAKETLGSGSVWDIGFSVDPRQQFAFVNDGTNQRVYVLDRKSLKVLGAFGGAQPFYGRVQALKGVDLDVNAGEIVALIGANGAGKSTLMMTVCGNPRAREGAITFDGHDITRLPTCDIARLKLAQAPEGRRIFPRMTVLENLQMGATVAAEHDFPEDLERVLTLFPRLRQRLTQRGGTLSGGEQQMLAIARALMSRPRLLLLDEPSLGLAPLIVRQIFDAIKKLNIDDGLTVFLVEQNAYHALKRTIAATSWSMGSSRSRAPAASCSIGTKSNPPIWRAGGGTQ